MKKLIFMFIFLGSVNAYASMFAPIPMPENHDMFDGVMEQWSARNESRARENQNAMERRQAQEGLQLQEQEAEMNQLKIEMMKEKLSQLKKSGRKNKVKHLATKK